MTWTVCLLAAIAAELLVVCYLLGVIAAGVTRR